MSFPQLSAESVYGPHSQHKRAERWWERYSKAHKADDMKEEIDYLLAFFESAYCYREWAKKASGHDALDFCSDNEKYYWGIVRDLTNRSKHLSISQPSRDADFKIFREHDHFEKQTKKWVLKIRYAGNSFELRAIAHAAKYIIDRHSLTIPKAHWDFVNKKTIEVQGAY
jgi:hypothetical protein